MFEHPDDVMKRDKADYKPCGLQSIMDIDDTYELQLPHFFPVDEPDSLPRIQLDTLISIIDGQHSQKYDNILIVDCRFEYEFQGGHIQGATNHNDKEVLANELFNRSAAERTLLIFHCEYSVHRAPIMAKFIRQRDRAVNENRYPHLTYPETYILDGGYSSFFKAHQTRCFPQNYVEMDAKEYEHACEKGMNKLRQRGKLGRAHTFAAPRSSFPDDSPLSQGRASLGASMASATFDDCFDTRKIRARRMASY
jgi:M-phase inducer tyrosine phosphatase